MTQGIKMQLVSAVTAAVLTLPTTGVAQQHLNSQGIMGQDPCYQSGSGHMIGQSWNRGMMGQGMMNPDTMGQGMIAPRVQNLAVADVKQMIADHLAWQGYPNLKIGAVEESEDHLIIAEIVTQDGSLVQRLQFDRTTGSVQPTR